MVGDSEAVIACCQICTDPGRFFAALQDSGNHTGAIVFSMTMPRSRAHRGAHTIHQLFVHLVFVPKNRRKFFLDVDEDYCFRIFDDICRDERLKCQLITMGTDDDHVHLLLRFPPKVALSELVRHLKGDFSYRWNRERADTGYKKFEWGVGYFVKTVGQSTAADTAKYINEQGHKKLAKSRISDVSHGPEYINKQGRATGPGNVIDVPGPR